MKIIWNYDNRKRKKVDKRSLICLGAFVMAFVVLIVTLFDMQILNGSSYANSAVTRKTRTLTVPGTRGKILDSNGIPLAVDEKIYKIEFYRDYNTAAQREMYTNSIIKAIEIIERNGHSIENSFAIAEQNGEYVMNWGNVSAETAATRENRWRQDFYFNNNETPEEMYLALREKYHIPDSMGDEQAFKVLAIWQDSVQNYYVSRSIVVAKNVSEETVAEIESYSYELPGFTINEATGRLYPQGETAAHVIGYMGRISASDRNYIDEYGYSADDTLGVYGVERIMELYLTGNGTARSGKRMVEVASSGRILRELSYTSPKQGDDVYLTIDINLQKVAEQALKENIEMIAAQQLEDYNKRLEYYQAIEKDMGRKINFASEGAAVVMDINSGAVLAMASYPSYDINLFAQGISQEDFNALLEDKRSPLTNKAISSTSMPGSIFKMVTATAGLMEGGISLDGTITCEGAYTKYGESDAPSCWYWRDYGRKHGAIDVSEAIEVSCNYFFYEVADRVGIEGIRKWAGNYGLLSKTNIELSNEAVGQVGNQEILYDSTKPVTEQATNMPRIYYNSIRRTLLECAENSGIELTDEQINDAMDRIMQFTNIPYADRLGAIRDLLYGELGMSYALVYWEVSYTIRDYLGDLVWTPIRTIATGIGQGITTVTPIAVARYISALVNGGTVYDAHVVQKVLDSKGNTVYETEPVVYNQLNVNDEYLNAIKEGMKDVISGEDATTATRQFEDCIYKDQLGGKTGTAQVNNINLENNSWFVAFAPYDKPEIAIVVFIPSGYAGGYSGYTVRVIAEHYLDQKYNTQTDEVPEKDSIVY